MSESGYSGTPLMKKLGIKPGMRGLFIGRRHCLEVAEVLQRAFEFVDLDRETAREGRYDYIHVFETDRSSLIHHIRILKPELNLSGMLWVSWPKRASGWAMTLDGNIVRQIGLDAGLVDIKVCAVDDVWSGLKFVIPVKDRKA